jgi:hydroxymethylpyrimidine/phosphomethylpyrimidine kinase
VAEIDCARPFALTIAGFDPSGGAGLLADVKVFECYQVYGQAVCTALTVQNESSFLAPGWVPWEQIQAQLNVLALERSYACVKIGLVENAEVLGLVLRQVRSLWPTAFVLWDPIIKASAGFDFHGEAARADFLRLLQDVDLVTPNVPEAEYLSGLAGSEMLAMLECYTNVLLKGGHGDDVKKSVDILSYGKARYELPGVRVAGVERHGSGCTFSAAIVANLAQGLELPMACAKAKEHVQRFFSAGSRKLGYVS